MVTLGLSKVTRPGPKGGRNPVEGSALAFHGAKPHQGANRWLGSSGWLRLDRERPNTLRYLNLLTPIKSITFGEP